MKFYDLKRRKNSKDKELTFNRKFFLRKFKTFKQYFSQKSGGNKAGAQTGFEE